MTAGSIESPVPPHCPNLDTSEVETWLSWYIIICFPHHTRPCWNLTPLIYLWSHIYTPTPQWYLYMYVLHYVVNFPGHSFNRSMTLLSSVWMSSPLLPADFQQWDCPGWLGWFPTSVSLPWFGLLRVCHHQLLFLGGSSCLRLARVLFIPFQQSSTSTRRHLEVPSKVLLHYHCSRFSLAWLLQLWNWSLSFKPNNETQLENKSDEVTNNQSTNSLMIRARVKIKVREKQANVWPSHEYS